MQKPVISKPESQHQEREVEAWEQEDDDASGDKDEEEKKSDERLEPGDEGYSPKVEEFYELYSYTRTCGRHKDECYDEHLDSFFCPDWSSKYDAWKKEWKRKHKQII